MKVYFDFLLKDGKAIVGAYGYKDELKLEIKKINIVDNPAYNQYHFSLLALIEALKLIDEVKTEDNFELLNQNKVIQDWILKGNVKIEYEELYLNVINSLQNILAYKNVSYALIESKTNKARKLLKAEKINIPSCDSKLSLNNIFNIKSDVKKVSGDNIVHIEKFKI